MFRQGVREGNLSLLLVGRFILGELFYTNNNRIYMEVNFRDIVTQIKSPAEILAALQHSYSFSHQKIP